MPNRPRPGKPPPLYVRAGPELRARVDAFTLEHELTTTDLVLRALEFYLDFHEDTRPEETC